jgi:hypothetical protein
MNRLCIIAVALAVIASARVAVLPGWVVPVPVLLLAAALALCAAVTGLVVLRIRADARSPRPWPEAAVPGNVPEVVS